MLLRCADGIAVFQQVVFQHHLAGLRHLAGDGQAHQVLCGVDDQAAVLGGHDLRALGGGAAKDPQGGGALADEGGGGGAAEKVHVQVPGGDGQIRVVHTGDLLEVDGHAFLRKIAVGLGHQHAHGLDGGTQQAHVQGDDIFGGGRDFRFRFGGGFGGSGGLGLGAAAAQQDGAGQQKDRQDISGFHKWDSFHAMGGVNHWI